MVNSLDNGIWLNSLLDLAKAINSAVAKKDELDKDFEKPGSALEIAFMWVEQLLSSNFAD